MSRIQEGFGKYVRRDTPRVLAYRTNMYKRKGVVDYIPPKGTEMDICKICGCHTMIQHNMLEQDGTIICPRDWVVEDLNTGKMTVMKNKEFKSMYMDCDFF